MIDLNFLFRNTTKVKLTDFKELHIENGQLHRTDGPAVVTVDGIECWIQNGKLHREHGPAAVDGLEEEWWLNGYLVKSRWKSDGKEKVYFQYSTMSWEN